VAIFETQCRTSMYQTEFFMFYGPIALISAKKGTIPDITILLWGREVHSTCTHTNTHTLPFSRFTRVAKKLLVIAGVILEEK